MNPYHVLGVPSNADFAALRAAYRQLVRVHHPDCAPDEAARAAATERMVRINWAWHIVSDAQRRAAFDARFRLDQFEAARRQQEAMRAQARGQTVRGQQAHLADVLKAQARRRQEQNREVRARQAAAQKSGRTVSGGAASAESPESPESPASAGAWQRKESERAREQQFLEWQALERARREREACARDAVTRPVRKRLSREEKKRQALARARLRRMRREDRRRSASPSARRQLAEAARLFGQEGRASEAIAICHEVLRVDFRNVPARELLGDFYLSLGRQDRALPLWEQALALQPDNAGVRRKLNSLRPHDPRSYNPQPHIPRAASAQSARFAPGRDSFWVRLRDAFCGGL